MQSVHLSNRIVLAAAGLSDIGKQRDNNEDCVWVDAELGLLIVADGVGGNAGGEVASAALVAYLQSHWASWTATLPAAIKDETLVEWVSEWIQEANQALWKLAQSPGQPKGMSTTLVMLGVIADRLVIAHVGDSRCYRYDGQKLQQLTEDHTLENVMAKLANQQQGAAKAGVNSGKKSPLFQSMGKNETVDPTVCVIRPQAGEVFMLCTDGVSDMLAATSIIDACQLASSNPTAGCEAIIKSVLQGEASDNATVALASIIKAPAAIKASRPVAREVQPEQPSHTLPWKPIALGVGALAIATGLASWLMHKPGQPQKAAVESVPQPAVPDMAAKSAAPSGNIATQDSAQARPAPATQPLPPIAEPQKESKPAIDMRAETEQIRPGNASAIPPIMVKVRHGKFDMGNSDNPLASPVHAVNIAYDFSISKYETTVGQWRKCVEAKACQWPDALPLDTDNALPITHISWNNAQTYVNWLSQKTHKTYRLPSEAEWEYAASGAQRSNRQQQLSADQANFVFWDKGPKHLQPVGQYPANPLGIHDMIGNAWEWTQDCYQKDYRSAPGDGRALQTSNCDRSVIRGGSKNSKPSVANSTERFDFPRTISHDAISFRVVEERVATTPLAANPRKKTPDSPSASSKASELQAPKAAQTHTAPDTTPPSPGSKPGKVHAPANQPIETEAAKPAATNAPPTPAVKEAQDPAPHRTLNAPAEKPEAETK